MRNPEFFPQSLGRGEGKPCKISILPVNPYKGLFYQRYCIESVEHGGEEWYKEESRV